jgi:hypothetical protein
MAIQGLGSRVCGTGYGVFFLSVSEHEEMACAGTLVFLLLLFAALLSPQELKETLT